MAFIKADFPLNIKTSLSCPNPPEGWPIIFPVAADFDQPNLYPVKLWKADAFVISPTSGVSNGLSRTDVIKKCINGQPHNIDYNFLFCSTAYYV